MLARLGAVLLSAAFAVGVLGCNAKRWDEVAKTNAEWADARQLNTCIVGSGGLEPYGYGHIVIGTGGNQVTTCAIIFGLPGAALLDFHGGIDMGQGPAPE